MAESKSARAARPPARIFFQVAVQMATRKERAANRRNAQRSTGPNPPEGKAVVRINALKHGLTAEDVVIFREDDEAFYELPNPFLAGC